MPGRRKQWVRVQPLTSADKDAIAAVCGRFIAGTLKPRFLPVIRPTQFNYPVDIFGKWRGRQYSFITRYRSGFPENAGEEFDAAFARFDHVEEQIAAQRFDVMWRRHTGQWYRLYAALPLDEALRLLSTEEVLAPC
jgi:hypothetical protein